MSDMKDEYDFSRGERGKFAKPGAQIVPPVHLEPDVLALVETRARELGQSLSAVVNAVLRREMRPKAPAAAE